MRSCLCRHRPIDPRLFRLLETCIRLVAQVGLTLFQEVLKLGAKLFQLFGNAFDTIVGALDCLLIVSDVL